MRRSELLTIIEGALAAGQARYAREAAVALLAAWPGDLSGRMALARAYLEEGDPMAALDLFEGVVAVDPERTEAQRALGYLFQGSGRSDQAEEAFAAAHMVDGQGIPAGLDAPEWAEAARAGWLAIARADWDEAQGQAERALLAAPDSPLPSLALLLSAWRPGSLDLARPLAEGFHARWPGVVAFSLCLAECLLAAKSAGGFSRDETRAIALLHEAGAHDPAGEVAGRYWGLAHSYRSLWPQAPDPELPGPLPNQVARILGRNVLAAPAEAHTRPAPAGGNGKRHENETRASRTRAEQDSSTPAGAPAPRPDANGGNGKRHKNEARASRARAEQGSSAGAPAPRQSVTGGNGNSADEIAEIQAELKRLEASLKPGRRGKAARAKAKQAEKRKAPEPHFSSPPEPLATHLIVSSRARLIRKYGQDGTAAVTAALDELAEAAAASTGGAVVVVYVDDRDVLRTFDLKPVDADRPWEIKLLLKDLAAAIGAKGGTLASVVIAGGDDILPFHRLPNPVDDSDGDVPSDNPYASSDENYLVPEWALGRLPAPAGGDPEPFLRLLRAAVAAHRAQAAGKRAKSMAGLPGLLERLVGWLIGLFAKPSTGGLPGGNFGYAARAWQLASEAVFSPIGDSKQLSTCPPLDVTGLPSDGLSPAPLSYFNLHGVEDGPEWYGQRDADDTRLPQYPIALRPANVANSGRAPGLVFSEACYGANIQGKQVDDALCLKFLDAGTRSVIASTKIAYGSIGTPLIGADLLGRLFWDYLKDGWPVGEALRLAKVAHAREMHDRQGYLDGEDQKTLISFVLYGDPLLPAPGTTARHGSAARAKARLASRPSENELTLCADDTDADPGVSRPEAVARIKSLVERHLPGMDDWAVQIAQQHRVRPGLAQKDGPARSKTLGPRTGNMVFTLSKSLPVDTASRRALSQYVRVTVNQDGKVVKMAVSR